MRKRWPLSAMCSPPGLVEAASEMTFQMAELQHYRLFNKAPFWHEPSMHRFGCFFGCFLRWKPARCLFVIRAVGPRLGGEVGPLGHSLVLGLWKESLGMKWCRVGGGRGPSCFSICTCGYSTSFPGGCLSGEDILNPHCFWRILGYLQRVENHLCQKLLADSCLCPGLA